MEAKPISRLPGLFAAQAASVSLVCRAFRAQAADVAPAEAPRPTLAEGIALPRPVRGARVLQALRESGGGVAAVSEDEIREGVRALGRAGFCVEPTSAVVWPARGAVPLGLRPQGHRDPGRADRVARTPGHYVTRGRSAR